MPATTVRFQKLILVVGAVALGVLVGGSANSVLGGVTATGFVLLIFYLSERAPDQ